jgi:hypothetical protein
MSDPELRRQARETLDMHRGHDHPIASRLIASYLGLHEDAARGTVQTRELLADLLAEGYPVGANERGYFRLETEAEFTTYRRELRDRVEGILARIHNLERAWAMEQHPHDEPPLTEPAVEPPPRLRWEPEPEEMP